MFNRFRKQIIDGNNNNMSSAKYNTITQQAQMNFRDNFIDIHSEYEVVVHLLQMIIVEGSMKELFERMNSRLKLSQLIYSWIASA